MVFYDRFGMTLCASLFFYFFIGATLVFSCGHGVKFCSASVVPLDRRAYEQGVNNSTITANASNTTEITNTTNASYTTITTITANASNTTEITNTTNACYTTITTITANASNTTEITNTTNACYSTITTITANASNITNKSQAPASGGSTSGSGGDAAFLSTTPGKAFVAVCSIGGLCGVVFLARECFAKDEEDVEISDKDLEGDEDDVGAATVDAFFTIGGTTGGPVPACHGGTLLGNADDEEMRDMFSVGPGSPAAGGGAVQYSVPHDLL